MRPTILFLFNTSDYAPRPWLDDGRFNVVSVDFDETDHSGAHREPVAGHTVLNIDLSTAFARDAVGFALLGLGMAPPSFVVSFVCCTNLSVAGAKHFASKLARDPECQNRAVRMAKLASEFDCPYMVENPVSILATRWKKPEFTFHPWEYSGHCPEGPHPEFPEVIPANDWYNKRTCLWTGNGFRMPPKTHREGPTEVFPGWSKLGGKSARTKYIRSLTPRGFSYALYAENHRQLLDECARVSPQQLELEL